MEEPIQLAVDVLHRGGVVLHATEGVWGLACDPWQAGAIEKILKLKNRAVDKGLLVLGASADEFAEQLEQIDVAHRERVLRSWPGPHTWVLPDVSYPPIIRGGRDTLACRVPGHAQARAMCRGFGGTLVSTSANVTGEPAITTRAQAQRQFAHLVEYFLLGEVSGAGGASVIHGADGAILR